MRVKLLDVVGAHSVLSKLMDSRMKASLSFKVGANVRALQPHVQEFEKQRIGICKREGFDYDETSGSYRVPADCKEDVAKEINELLDVEVEVDTIPLSMEGLDTLELSPREALAIDWLVAE